MKKIEDIEKEYKEFQIKTDSNYKFSLESV